MTAAVRAQALRVVLGSFTGTEVPSWLPGLLTEGLGGICLYGDNLGPTDDSVGELARSLSRLAPRAVIAIDEEGGDVTRLHAGTGSPYPGNAVLGRHDDVGTTRAVAAAIGAELKECGVWLDLAPCADVNSNPRNPVIGTRSFGAAADVVARHTRAYVDGLQSQGVAACLKHFPGHGDTSSDSHIDLPRVTGDLREVLERDVAPFAATIESAPPAAIMTSHIVVDALDPAVPATLSHRILTGLLRETLGYDGLIVTDALDMAGASAGRGIPAAAVESIGAGADLLCIGPDPTGSGPTHVLAVVDALEEAVGSGELDPDRLLDAARRVDVAAERWATGAAAPRQEVVRRGRERGAAAVAALLPDRPRMPQGRPAVVRIDTAANAAVGATAWGELGLDADLYRVGAGLPAPEALASHDGPVVVVARRVTSDPAVWAWVSALRVARPDTVVVELGWPGPDLGDLPNVVLGWGASRVVCDAIGTLLEESPA